MSNRHDRLIQAAAVKDSLTAQTEIRAVREQAEARLRELSKELQDAKRAEAVADASSRLAAEVLRKFEAGMWASGHRRIWWHSDEQILIEPVTPDELQAMRELKARGVLSGGSGVSRPVTGSPPIGTPAAGGVTSNSAPDQNLVARKLRA